MQKKKLSNVLDPRLISVKEFRELNSKLEKNKIKIYPQFRNFLKRIIIQILIFLMLLACQNI